MTDEQTELFMANKELVPWVLINKLKISPTDSFFDDLKQEGYIALMQSCEGFDPDNGTKFSVYAVNLIYWKTLDYLQRNQSPISRNDRGLLAKWSQAQQDGMSMDEFCRTQNVKPYLMSLILNRLNPINLDSTIPGRENDMTYAESIPDPATLNGLHIDDELPLSMDEIKDAIMVVADDTTMRRHRDVWVEYCYALIYMFENDQKGVSEKKQKYLSKKYHISQSYVARVIGKGMNLLQKELKKKLDG